MPRHVRRRPEHGQSLLIFALIAVVLFAVIGLAVDGGFSYFASDRLERGAMAGALAGVPSMPDFSTAPNDATSTALLAAAKNGWSVGGVNNIAISVDKVPLPPPAPPNSFYNNRLSVTITSDVPVFFLKLLGFGAHKESRTAVAEYLRPITFGQPGNQLGSTQTDLGGAGYYFMRSEGWATDRGQGDAYGPNPTNAWTAYASSPNDTHALSLGTETLSQPPFALPDRGGQNYQIYVPANESAKVNVYNPTFAPDNGAIGSNPLGYNYHEDDGDFTETALAGQTCKQGQNILPSNCVGPANVKEWPIMSYTVYKSVNPFDHTNDQWLTNLRVKSIDAAAGASPATYTIPGVAGVPLALSALSYYHGWADVQQSPPAGGPNAALVYPAQTATYNGGAGDGLSGGATGTTYRLRVDQLDQASGDPMKNGQNRVNSRAHKGYAVQVAPVCLPTPCTVTALNDITLFTPIKGGATLDIPFVSVPPEYQGRAFSLYLYDPGDVQCCSNTITVMRPNGFTAGVQNMTTATNNNPNPNPAVFSGSSTEADTASYNQVTPAAPILLGEDKIQTQNASGTLYNGKWIRFDITVPSNYQQLVDPNNTATWFWHLAYVTALPASDTITANLGLTGAPVHLVSG